MNTRNRWRRKLWNFGRIVLSLTCPVMTSDVSADEGAASKRPNIIWIMAEDISTELACYGHPAVDTPNLDRLAKQGTKYENAFCTAPSCTPSRNAMITGVYQTRTDTQDQRRGGVVLPDAIKPIPHLLQDVGYFAALGCGYNKKTDLNFTTQKPLFDGKDWKEREPDQPFFAQITLYSSHRLEPHWSGGWAGIRKRSTDPVDVSKVELPPYLPDTPITRLDWAEYLDSIELVDSQVGEILQRLEDEGIADDTVVIFCGDNGRCHLRGKCWLYDGGLKVPLIIRWPERLAEENVAVQEDLVSMIDVSATVLSVAGVELPEVLDGRPLIGSQAKQRSEIFAARDLVDEVMDHIRCVRTKQYKYIRNYTPENGYRECKYVCNHRPMWPEIQRLASEGKLTETQQLLLKERKPVEELYDVVADPHEIHNLAGNADYAATIKDLRGRLDQWLKDTDDRGLAAMKQSQKRKSSPNVVLILADDLGYGDVSCYGGKGVQTPNIDRLAAEGTRFTNGYCSASTCTPTRYSLLTGVYAFRTPGTGIAPPNQPALIPAGTPTLASIMQDAGYATAVIGKWHLGLGKPGKGPDWNGKIAPGPLEIGFDHCLLLPTTNDRVPQVYVRDHHVDNLDPSDPLWVGNKKPSDDHPTVANNKDKLRFQSMRGHRDTFYNGVGRIGFYTGGHSARFCDEDLADRWVDASKRWINDHKGEPFFLFFSSHDIHAPRITHERFRGTTSLGPRGDMIAELDWSVGELVDYVEQLGLTEQTLFVFCSDNGPVLNDDYIDGSVKMLGDHDPNGPFRGGKYNVFEGGTRTPFITRMPGTVPVGVNDQMVCTIDLAASMAAMLNQSGDTFIDSENVMDALLGKPNAKGRDALVQQANGGWGRFAYREGRWKIARNKGGAAYNANLRLKNSPVPELALYDLQEDPGESNDLSGQKPELTERLNAQMEAIMQRRP
ncbi:sulfatase-like hydrolase/transferase [Crateriforma spongiae]|uniref:sulfatase-like hydrolase/transferase n=1 Tax=Crateriforma spongiae TaxID=2724528 RepID=UPI0039AEC6C9